MGYGSFGGRHGSDAFWTSWAMTLALGEAPAASSLESEHGARYPNADWPRIHERCRRKVSSYRQAARALVASTIKTYDQTPPFSALPSAQLLLWLVRDLEAIAGAIPDAIELARTLQRLDVTRRDTKALLPMCRHFIAGYREALAPDSSRQGATSWPTPNPMTPVPQDRDALIGRIAELSLSPAAHRADETSLDLTQTDVDLDAEAVARARASSELRRSRYRACEQAVSLWRRGRGAEARKSIARLMSDEPGPLAYLIDLIAETENDELVDVLEEIYIFASEPWVKEHARRTARRLKGIAA